jgi:hypothetical protein
VSCERHPKHLRGFDDLDQAARAVADLHYQYLASFLGRLGGHIQADAIQDKEDGRRKLAAKLFDLSKDLERSSHTAAEIWGICAPYMEDPHMITIHVGHDGAGGFTFALSPQDKNSEMGFPNRVFVAYERGTTLEDFKDKWPAIGSMLVGCTMEGMPSFQIVEMPDGTVHAYP